MSAVAPMRSARDAVVQGAVMTQQEIDVHSPRFFVQMGWSVLNVDTDGIPNRYLLRGEITPCVSKRAIENIKLIPEGMLIADSQKQDKDFHDVWGEYWKPAYFEAQRLTENEGASERPDGLREIVSLYRNQALYRKVDLNKLFYPQGLDSLPEKNVELIEHLEGIRDQIQAKPPAGVEPYEVSALMEIVRELIEAVKVADRIQAGRLRYSHLCMKMSPKEEQYKREYDSVDLEMLARTGEPEINEADRTTANALMILAEGSASRGVDPSIMALIEAQREQNAILKEQNELFRQQILQNQQSATTPVASPVGVVSNLKTETKTKNGG